MNPREVLEHAKSEKFSYIDYDIDGNAYLEDEENLEVHPGLTPAEIDALDSRLTGPLPQDVRDLLFFSSGFTIGGYEVVFTEMNGWGYDFLLPNVAVLAGDGTGNSWVIEIHPESGDWRHVWFENHDPPVLMYQCETLTEFIEAVLDESRFDKAEQGHRGMLHNVHEKSYDLWCKNGRFPEARSIVDSSDTELAQFAATLNPTDLVADLRNPKLGDGFDWSLLNDGPTPVKRKDHELIFGIPAKTGFFSRVFGWK